MKLVLILYFIKLVLSVEFVIQLKNNYTLNSFISNYYSNDVLIQDVGLKGFEIGKFKGIIGDFNIDLMKSIYNDPNIGSISIDRNLVLAEVQEFAPKHLARVSQFKKLDLDRNEFDFIYDETAGIGVDIYVLDSGINKDHEEFDKRVTKLADFTNEPINFKDHIGHGSYIAGVIGSKTFGIAKKANLFDIKVTEKNGKTKLSSVINALSLILHDSKITKRPSLVVLPLIMAKNAILNGAVESLINEGIPVISPAGNDGKQACNYSPASAKGTLTVGAIDDETDLISTFSNWGSCVDIFAPGVKIQTTSNINNEVVIKSGTSLSTGIAAGLVAYYMGMGDSGSQAIERVLRNSNDGLIPQESFVNKPLTINKILFNGEGEPNWGVSP